MFGVVPGPVVAEARLAATAALCSVLFASPALSVDLELLPPHAHYTRNSSCKTVAIKMPPSTHAAVESNLISPEPAKMPLSQGDYLICFAYATADMISQRVGSEISALDVATKYYFADPSRLGASTNPELRRHLKSIGDYRGMIAASRATMEVSSDENSGLVPFVDKLEGGEEDVAALLYNIDGLCLDQDLPSYDGYSHFQEYLDFMRARMQLFPPARYSRPVLAAAAPALYSPNADAFNAAWLQHVARQCRRIPLLTPLLPVSYRVAENAAEMLKRLEQRRPPGKAKVDRLFSIIDYALDHGRAPAVGYSWFVLAEATPKETDLVGDHSSVIIGRRKAGKACQYRVQDNTGEYCAHMRKGISERCDFGRIWLTETELKRTLYSVTYLR